MATTCNFSVKQSIQSSLDKVNYKGDFTYNTALMAAQSVNTLLDRTLLIPKESRIKGVYNLFLDKKVLNSLIETTEKRIEDVKTHNLKNNFDDKEFLFQVLDSLEKGEAVATVLDTVSANIAKRLGISLAEYKERNRAIYLENPVSSQEAIELLALSSGGALNFNPEEVITLFQPNQELKQAIEKNHYIKSLNLDLNNIEHQWIAKYIITTETGKTLVKRLHKNLTLENLKLALKEEFKLIQEKANSTNEYYIEELSDAFIEAKIQEANAHANSENVSLWESIKKDKETAIKNYQKNQKNGLTGILAYYETAHEYPMAMKLMIIESILNNDYSYDIHTKKYSKKQRAKNTLGLHYRPLSLFMNKVINHPFSSAALFDDYFYEAYNFKGTKIDLNKYQNNIHQSTSKGTWYKFSKNIPGDNELFYNMSSLSSLHKGSWCTGGNQTTADNYLDRGDMYLFYDNETNMSLVQLHVANNSVIEVGGSLEGQGSTEYEIKLVDEFDENNPKIDLGKIRMYQQYSKLLGKWNKAKRDNSVLTREEKKILLNATPYFKDNTTNLQDFKKSLSKKDYAEIYNTNESNIFYSSEFTEKDWSSEAIVIGDFRYKGTTISKQIAKHITGGIDLDTLETLTTKAFDSAGENVYMSNLKTLTTKAFDSVGRDVFMHNLKTLTTKAFDSAGRDVIMDNLSSTRLTEDDITQLSQQFYSNLNSSIEDLKREGLKEADEIKEQLGTTFQKYLQNIVREGDISLLDLKKPISNSHTTLNQDSRGIIALTKNTSLTIFSRKSDITTIIHEKAHEYERVLTKDEIKILEQWSGYKYGTTDFSEAFAKGAEKVIYGGTFGNEDVNNIFQKLAKWFREVIENAFDYFYSLNDMNSDVIEIYRKMLLKSPTQQQQYQDLKSKPEFQQAVKEAFEESEELQEIGTNEQFNDYIARISTGLEVNPMTGEYNDSNRTEVFYHGTNTHFDVFNDNGLLFVTNNKDDASTFATLRKSNIIIPVIINVQNPRAAKGNINYDYIKNGFGNNDAITQSQDRVAVKSSSQILIINGPDAIRGFKEFVNRQNNSTDNNIRYSQYDGNNSSEFLQEGLQWLKEIMPDVQPELVDGLIDGIADGKYDILQDLITLSKDYATKATVREEAFHRAFSMIPQSEREKLLDEASKKYGIPRGESKVTARYSQAQEKQIQYSLKAVELLQSDKAKEIFEKGAKNGWTLEETLDALSAYTPTQNKELNTELRGEINKIQKELQQNIPDVILPIGTSGSGKSTFIKSLPQENLVVIEPDAMRVEFTREEQINQKLQELINNKEIEENCKGNLKAEKGLATSFTKGGKWKVIKDLKGYPTHKEGGVDLTIGKNGVTIKNGNTQFTAKYGLVIPKN